MIVLSIEQSSMSGGTRGRSFTPPSAGFNVTFEDLTLDTAAGAPLIFARLTAVKTGAYTALELLSRRVTWGRVNLSSILTRSWPGGGGGRVRPPERGLLELPQWVLSHPPPPHEVELDLGPEKEGPRKGQASKSS